MAEKPVTEDAVKMSGRDGIFRTGQEETADHRSEGTNLDVNVPVDSTGKILSGQLVENSMESDEEKPEDMSQTTELGDLTELFAVSENEEDTDENEELLQKYYEKLMKEEEENRQFEVYGQDREQQPCQSSLFDSDADSGCFDLSIDGFGITDD